MTPRKQAFVDQMLTCHNATEAARRAGYSAKTAKQAGSRLLSDVDVQAALTAGRQQAQEQAGITAADIARELGRLSFANISDIVSWDGNGRLLIKPSAELNPDVLAAIAEIAETESKTGQRLLRVKLHSKTTAIDLLTRLRTIEELASKVDALQALVNAQPAEGLHRSNGYAHTR